MKLVWFRNDLRVDDNPALSAAGKDSSQPMAAIYFVCQEQNQHYGIGGNQRALLSQQLQQLHCQLAELNVPLFILNAGHFKSVPQKLNDLCKRLSVEQLYFNIEYPIDERTRDRQVVEQLSDSVTCIRSVGDSLLAPWEVVNASNSGYKVFTPFQRAHSKRLLNQPVQLADKFLARHKDNLLQVERCLENSLTENPILLTQSWLEQNKAELITDIPLPFESTSQIKQQLNNFCEKHLFDYTETRDLPYVEGTSGLSAALAIGAISVRECYVIANNFAGEAAFAWTRQLIWRDFYRSVIWHYPKVSRGDAFLDVDKAIRWSDDSQAIERFKTAQTGVPIIDAAINQLLNTGWMHNRLRMVVASYLTKNLWIDWRIGEAFFAEHLFDYDFANNNGGWQWSASVGTDASPYFRVFNPHSQQKKFDPEAIFIKRWLTGLQDIDAKNIHQFDQVQLTDYPTMQVDLKESRKQAIETFKNARVVGSLHI